MSSLILIVDKVLSIFCKLLMALLTLAVIGGVILRYLFSISFMQLEEGICMLFICITFFGVALGVRENDHISIQYFYEKSSYSVKKILYILNMLVVIFVSSVVFFQSIIWIKKVGNVISVPLQIPYGYCYTIVPISTIFTIFYAITKILGIFIKIPEPERDYIQYDEIAEQSTETPIKPL